MLEASVSNAISSAAPCHVVLAGSLYDVIVWTIDDDALPVPWINRDGRVVSLYELPSHLHPELYTGTALEHVQGTR